MTKSGARHPLAATLPSIDLPLTICVLAYGPHRDLAGRFLRSLYNHTDPRLFYLRAGLNEAGPATRKLFRDYAARFKNIILFIETKNIFKYPMMRRMFYESPLATAWTIWCDDDTHFKRPDWMQRLGLKIECSPEVSMWGKPYLLWRRDQFILDWIKAAAWYRGLPCVRGKDRNGNDAAKFSFVTGGFWAIRTEILRGLNWPDPRLVHTTGDFLLGEALRQNRLTFGRFDYGVNINDAPRRNPKEAAAVSPRA
jgi:GT2 family glycosyltransferase